MHGHNIKFNSHVSLGNKSWVATLVINLHGQFFLLLFLFCFQHYVNLKAFGNTHVKGSILQYLLLHVLKWLGMGVSFI
jgi:hypothetical protein